MLSISISFNALSDHGLCTAAFVAIAACLGFGLGSVRTLSKVTWLAWAGLACILTASKSRNIPLQNRFLTMFSLHSDDRSRRDWTPKHRAAKWSMDFRFPKCWPTLLHRHNDRHLFANLRLRWHTFVFPYRFRDAKPTALHQSVVRLSNHCHCDIHHYRCGRILFCWILRQLASARNSRTTYEKSLLWVRPSGIDRSRHSCLSM